jgi:hypothetical protein
LGVVAAEQIQRDQWMVHRNPGARAHNLRSGSVRGRTCVRACQPAAQVRCDPPELTPCSFAFIIEFKMREGRHGGRACYGL